MEHVGTSVAAGPPEPLDQDYLDVEPNPQLDVEGLDFGMDGSYEEVERILADGTFDVGPEPDVALQETHTSFSGVGHAEATEAAEDVGHGAEAEVDYQDEIGYEDDDSAANDFNVDFSGTKATGGAVDGLQNASPEAHAGSNEPVDERARAALTHGNDSSWGQGPEFKEQDESDHPPSQLDDGAEEQVAEEQTVEEETDEHAEANDLTVDDLNGWADFEQSAVDHASELGHALEALSQPGPPVPRIEVLYEDGSYLLIGTPSDDSDSYFLSEATYLDRPLSQLLSALRAVITEDLLAADELVARFDPLDLEFGERSNEKFLNRSLCEVLDCHATLGQVPGVSTHPVIRLSVRRDAEDHFLELLGEAELVKGLPRDAEDSDMSEDSDFVPANAVDDGHTEEEMFTEENRGDYQGEVEDLVTDHIEDENEPEIETALDHNDVAADPGIPQSRSSTHQSPGVAGKGMQNEEHSDNLQPGAHYHEPGEDPEAGELETWDEQAAEGYAALQHTPQTQDAEGPVDPSHNQAHEAGEEESNAAPEVTVDETAIPGHGGLEQEAYSNGKYPPLFLSAPPILGTWKSPATISPLPDNEGANQPAAQASGSAIALEQDEYWEIDYSDDEQEPTPIHVLGAGASQVSQSQARCAVSVGGEKLQNRIHPRFVDSFQTTTTESSGISLACPFSTNADQDAAQDDDFVLAFDEEPAIPTIREETDVHEDYTLTYEASDIGDDAEAIPEANAAQTAEESRSRNLDNEVAARTAETSSIHTSTTINGDEIDYEEEDVTGDSLTPADDGADQSAAALSANNDEIDWENDEDEYEQRPAEENVGAESEESREAALTPPSIAGKRTRTDETESLAEETGMTACPPHKRMRIC
ncbi:hypothetical protein N658DRAFT_438454 [Parathielavia hyrcaniae]|uniref:Uncharacterized protein n=1 Tax=Parathielavia hyrcaniae TaxID=113614 RepID=A0AAN6T6U7_9PEZI|nr:hypothetical protein N658DRAFT_438454 [Parathielavia hyrcaniae]